MWDKIEDGRLASATIPARRRPSWDYQSGVSDIVRHLNSLGYHVATTHRITMPDGSTPHWDAKDIHIGHVVLFC